MHGMVIKETQGVLFDDGSVNRKGKITKVEKKLENGFEAGDKRCFLVEGENVPRWLDSSEVRFLRNGEKTSVVPIINVETIESIDSVKESMVACRICIDQPDEVREEEGVLKGIYKVNYGNGKSEMVCEHHKPMFKKDLPKLKDIGIPDRLKRDLKD
jgi:hypothetical protein